jgi:hypothetical protein
MQPPLEVGVILFIVVSVAQAAILVVLRALPIMHWASNPSDLDPFGR